MVILKVIIEGIVLGALLYLMCAVGIRNGAVNMVYLYDEDVQKRVVELGLTTPGEIHRRGVLFRALCFPAYIIYILICAYWINGARGFLDGFWQMFLILSIMNLIDRLLVDGYWVGRTQDWVIPGTEDLQPYITAQDKKKKWLMGTVGMAVIAALLSLIMSMIL